MLSMHKVLIGLMTLVMPASLAAQKLTPGTWTGTISPPDQDALAASFVVRMPGDTTKLTLMAGGMEAEASGEGRGDAIAVHVGPRRRHSQMHSAAP